VSLAPAGLACAPENQLALALAFQHHVAKQPPKSRGPTKGCRRCRHVVLTWSSALSVFFLPLVRLSGNKSAAQLVNLRHILADEPQQPGLVVL
jgi:hypothetical protein